jgi:tetratricopeptide (TPR) repeat protein
VSEPGDDTKLDTGRPTPEPEPTGDHDPLRWKIAVSLAALVVLGGALAILQVDASAFESNTARQTTRTAIEALRANVVASTVDGLKPEFQAERDFLAFRRPLVAGAPTLGSAAGHPSASVATRGSLEVAQRSVPTLGLDPLFVRLETSAQELSLKQRALATTRIAWNDRSTQYTTVIAVLAAALFLVGFSLVAEGPIRRTAYALGVAIGLFTLAWGMWFYVLPIPSTPNAAIRAAARGAVLTDTGAYDAAVAQYDTALARDGRLAAAYAGRSSARLLGANPDYRVTRAVTAIGGRTIAEAVDDAKNAFRLDTRNSLAADLVAITSFYQRDYEGSLSAVDRSLAINRTVPDVWVLKSANEVALGDRAAARASLDHALPLLRDAALSDGARLLVSSYLSYLAWIARYEPARAPAARELANRVVALETRYTLARKLPPTPPTHGSASVRGLRYAGGKLMLRLRWHDLPTGTALSGIGYERPQRNGAWTQPPDLALFANVRGSGSRDIAVPLERACAPVRVRVDLYLNGVPTKISTGPGVQPTC